jgi:O-antigen ligase
MSILFAAAIAVAIAGPIILARAQPYVLRGQTEQRASELSGRVHFWQLAIPVWKESPVIGRGLLTASRFEVLDPAGLGRISTIHSAWIEALVGTGVAGTALLAGSVLVAWRRALAKALRKKGRLLAVVILTTVSVESFTGSDFAIFGLGAMLFLLVALSLKDALPGSFRSHKAGLLATPDPSLFPGRCPRPVARKPSDSSGSAMPSVS